MAEAAPSIVIRRVKKVVGGGHHGGAWKVAFADFATAMMAFFLLMWLIAATTKEQKGAIAEYFNNPSMLDGRATAPSPGMNGPGGASTSLIKLGTGTDIGKAAVRKPTKKEIEQAVKAMEHRKLESLMKEMQAAIEKSQALEPFKDQLLLDITPAGLRIQIVDKQNRPMFDIGSTSLKSYTTDILHELAKFIGEVPNRISISGHTDLTAYNSTNGYTNWELSADRANAARRTLLAGGLSDDKVAVVVGLSSSVLFDKLNPQAPINRRISIIVMTREAEAAATGEAVKEYAGGDPEIDAAAIEAAKAADLAAAKAAEGAAAGTPDAAAASADGTDPAPAPAAAEAAAAPPPPAGTAH
nr:flagellar motor protein MotB [Nevskia sp.]